MSDIATVERETQEAVSENRRELVERLNRIRRDQDLSGTAKERYASQARREAEERATAETLEQNEKRVFKLYYPSESNLTPLQQEAFRSAYRHSIFRCMDLPESTLDRIMARAQRTGDRALEQACYHECVDRGLFGLANEYRERHPEAKQAWETYEQARRHAESNDALLGRALLSNSTP